MGKRKDNTPRSRVRAALRQLWLRSRERAAAIKREGGHCESCGVKQSAAKGKEVKLEVHHQNGVEWEQMIDQVYETLLCHPDGLTVLCKQCHEEHHEKETTT